VGHHGRAVVGEVVQVRSNEPPRCCVARNQLDLSASIVKSPGGKVGMSRSSHLSGRPVEYDLLRSAYLESIAVLVYMVCVDVDGAGVHRCIGIVTVTGSGRQLAGRAVTAGCLAAVTVVPFDEAIPVRVLVPGALWSSPP